MCSALDHLDDMVEMLSAEIAAGTKPRTCERPLRLAAAMTSVALLFGLASCTTPLDMSGERLTPPGPEWGLVIGSVLVRPQKGVSGRDVTGQDASGSGSSYEFNIVRIQPGDPKGEGPYVERYRLNAKAGEERIFISRLRSGQFLMKSFQEEGLTGLGGEMDLVFTCMAGEIRYIGRVLVEIPERISKGKGYRFTVENARAPTLAQVSRQHADLTKDVVDVPMQARQQPAP